MQLEVFERPDIIALLKLHNIVVGKPPASTTEITQPCDAGNGFKSSKCAVKYLPEEMCLIGKVNLLRKVKDIIKSHHKEFKTRITPAHLTPASGGIIRILSALHESINKDVIEKSFRITEIHPFNVTTMIGQSRAEVTMPMDRQLRDKIGHLSGIIEARGEIEEAEFEAAGIVCTIDRSNKTKKHDDLVLNRRRSVIITHKNVIDKEDAKRVEQIE